MASVTRAFSLFFLGILNLIVAYFVFCSDSLLDILLLVLSTPTDWTAEASKAVKRYRAILIDLF